MSAINKLSPQETLKLLLRQRYPMAKAAFWAGSITKNEGTATSDLDLVVIFDHVKHAYREAFVFEGWPIDAFIHDPQTITYFFEQIDKPSKNLALPKMIADGIEILSSSELGKKLREQAASLVNSMPEFRPGELDFRRFLITDLLDDLQSPKTQFEKFSIVSELYKKLAEFHLLSNNCWIGSGKHLARSLSALDPVIAERFNKAFTNSDNLQQLTDLVRDVLQPSGGFLWNGFHLDAPEEWRVQV